MRSIGRRAPSTSRQETIAVEGNKVGASHSTAMLKPATGTSGSEAAHAPEVSSLEIIAAELDKKVPAAVLLPRNYRRQGSP